MALAIATLIATLFAVYAADRADAHGTTSNRSGRAVPVSDQSTYRLRANADVRAESARGDRVPQEQRWPDSFANIIRKLVAVGRRHPREPSQAHTVPPECSVRQQAEQEIEELGMGERSGRLDTDQAEWTATVQRLQGMIQHLRTKHESEEAVVAELRARVQNAEGAFEAAWNVIARLETDIADLRRQLAIPANDNGNPHDPRSAGQNNRSRFDEEGFFAAPKGRERAG